MEALGRNRLALSCAQGQLRSTVRVPGEHLAFALFIIMFINVV